MTRKRHVEISGAGIAGLVAGVAFAQRGWSVTIHDRYPSLRIEGFGISLFENSLRVLESLGVYEDTVREANWMRFSEYRVEGVKSQQRTIPGRAFRVSRRLLTQALADRAIAFDAELIFDSEIVAAEPDGVVIDSDGNRREADLVIAADGVNSLIRESLNLRFTRQDFAEGAMRIIVRREPDDISAREASTAVEWWSGMRRVIFSPCSETEHYLALTCLEEDTLGKQVPIDVDSWSSAFPDIAYVFRRAREEVDWSRVQWSNFAEVYPERWSCGRVALVGDSAHAMPPNLGQGGGTAIMNAMSLACRVADRANIAEALGDWERAERPLTDHTQAWSVRYLRISRLPPRIQSAIFWTMTNFKPLRARLSRTARHWPTGAVDQASAEPLPVPRAALLANGMADGAETG